MTGNGSLHPPDVIDVELRFRSEPAVPTSPSILATAPEVRIRNHDAVPVAFADESAVIASMLRATLQRGHDILDMVLVFDRPDDDSEPVAAA